jgi:IclR family mhp operon transcriptional activator
MAATDVRLLRVLEALNNVGNPTVLDLARATGISRPAVYRIVEHLCRSGYAQRVPGDSRVRLTSKVRALSAGYRDDDRLGEVSRPILLRLQKDLRWPSSVASADKDRMVVRETNRYSSPFVFDAGGVGMRLPILASSLGLAYVAFCPQDQLDRGPDRGK